MSPLKLFWLKIKSYFNNTEALFDLGQCYLYGLTVGVNLPKSYKLLSRAASLGKSEAKEFVEKYFIVHEDKVKINPAIQLEYDAVRSISMAVDKGDPAALYLTGRVKLADSNDEKYLKQGLKMVKKAAEKKYYPAVFLMGILYLGGQKNVRKDEVKGWRYVEEAADNGVVEAMDFISHFKDPELAKPLYEKFYAEGNKNLGLQLGMYCLDNLDKEGNNIEKGLGLLEEACNEKNPNAAINLALIYDKGLYGCAPDLKKALAYYEKAAEFGSDEAMNSLGDKYQYTPEIQDFKKAFELFSQAYSKGNYNAANNLGTCYKRGIGVEQDAEKARQLYEEAYAHDVNGAVMNLFFLYSDGVCLPPDPQKANQYLKIAATREDPIPQAQFLYGKHLIETGEREKGFKLLESAASKDYSDALLLLGFCYMEGFHVKNDKQKAFDYFKKAASLNNVPALFEMGKCYLYGRYVDKDFVEARKWLTLAAEQGHPDAQFELGVCHRFGEGGPKDIYMAMHWYKKAAEQGNSRALHNMGIIYENGIGDIEVDNDKAFHYYSLAAEKDNRDSIFCLGCMYFQGKGVEKDQYKAVELFKKAAELGEPDSMYHLAWCYQEGIGVEPDIKISLDYLKKSASLGWKPAIDALKQIGLS